jgi:hypothetical protein
MAGEQGYLVRMLRTLEALLAECGHQPEATLVGEVLQRLSRADDLQQALESLYAVDGLDEFALRLMWFSHTMKATGQILPSNQLIDHQVQELFATLLTLKRRDIPPVPRRARDLADALRVFGAAVEEMKRESFLDGMFHPIDPVSREGLLRHLAPLEQTAALEGNGDAETFARAFSSFVQFVLQRQLTGDVRVLNLVDNANMTLQTVLEAVGAEDFDALQQTIQLLENPDTIFEQ